MTRIFDNAPALLSDGVFPAEFSTWTDPTNTRWMGQTGVNGFVATFDDGQIVSVDDLLVSIDNNHAYQVDYSTDGISWAIILGILINAGDVNFGMATLSTNVALPEYDGNANFARADARYLRIYATGGDNSYSLGEFQAITAVPKPETLAIVLSSISLLLIARRRS